MKGKRLRISKSSTYIKLFQVDEKYINIALEERRGIDENFSNKRDAVRHYVHIGIAAEISTTDIRKSLENSIVKRSQKEAVRKELEIVTSDLLQIINYIEEFRKETAENFGELMRSSNTIEAKVDRLGEKIDASSGSLNTALQEFFNSLDYSVELIEKNLLLMRTINYLIVLMHKDKRVKIEEIELTTWRDTFKKIYNELITLDESAVNEQYFQEFERGLMQRVGNFVYENNF